MLSVFNNGYLKVAILLIIPKTSCEQMLINFPLSSLKSSRIFPLAQIISLALEDEKFPKMDFVITVAYDNVKL